MEPQHWNINPDPLQRRFSLVFITKNFNYTEWQWIKYEEPCMKEVERVKKKETQGRKNK